MAVKYSVLREYSQKWEAAEERLPHAGSIRGNEIAPGSLEKLGVPFKTYVKINDFYMEERWRAIRGSGEKGKLTLQSGQIFEVKKEKRVREIWVFKYSLNSEVLAKTD